MEMWKWIIGIAIILIIIIIFFVFYWQRKKEKERRKRIRKSRFSDSDFYNLNDNVRYRKSLYNQVNVDFKPYLQQLYQSIDNLNAKVERYNNEINQAQYNSMLDIMRSADAIERQIKSYWESSKFNKDFLYYIGLHYASHLLACSIKCEQQKIKNTFVACKKKQEDWGRKIDVLQRQQEKAHGEQKRKLSMEIKELCQVHKNISILKSQIGAINTKYNQRVTQQHIETAKRRDYIGSHCGERGKKWRDRIISKHPKN